MTKALHFLRTGVLFCLMFGLTSIAYCGEFSPDNENAKLRRGDWSILKKLPGRDGQSLYDFMKSNRLKVSKTSEDVYCRGHQLTSAKVPEGCYVGFRMQRAGLKDEYCSPSVGGAPCGLSMVYFQSPNSKQFVPYSNAARSLERGAVSSFIFLIDEENKSYCYSSG
jgi:hypothetical protein